MGVTSAVRMVENLVGHPDISMVHDPDSVWCTILAIIFATCQEGVFAQNEASGVKRKVLCITF
jgi:hypothetical protein